MKFKQLLKNYNITEYSRECKPAGFYFVMKSELKTLYEFIDVIWALCEYCDRSFPERAK